ncbi:MAG: FaeA/PapI family transcriptional regulator [Methanotrichaceae archaeon]
MLSYEDRILKVIEDSKMGLTTVDVAKHAGVSKTTAIKYLSVLKSEGMCEFVEIGPSKLWRSQKSKVERDGENAGTLCIESALETEGNGKTAALPLSILAQMEDISEDVTISMSFKVKPDKVGAFMKLIKKYARQKSIP